MNRIEAEDFVYRSYLKAEKNQDYHAKDAQKRHPELTRELIERLSGTPAVTITGSKGKGSVANMISQILQTAYKVGMMTSPHLENFCERFKINGVDISDEDFALYMTKLAPEIEETDREIPENICISPMGIQAALALTYFNEMHTDFNILEGGKGVRYDDVNNVRHDYGIINSIFLEHTRELGSTIEEIAGDKACMITGTQKCVFVGLQQESVLEVIKQRAKQYQVPLKIYGEDFYAEHISYRKSGMVFDVVIGEKRYKDLCVPLLGEHQARNCALALAFSLEVLPDPDIEKIKESLMSLDWPGRMEVLSSDPFVMLDACINSASCQNVKGVMKHLNLEDATVVIGIPDDKDYAGVVRNMREASGKIILTKSQNIHYVFTEMQKRTMQEEGIETTWTSSIEEAIALGKEIGKPIVILGTTSVVSEVKKYFRSC